MSILDRSREPNAPHPYTVPTGGEPMPTTPLPRKPTPAKAKAKPKAKPKEPTVDQKWAAYERALIVTAHPDDAEFLAGGTIAKLCDVGMDVTLCVATSGDKG